VFAYTASGEAARTMTPMDSIKYHNQHMQLGSPANANGKFSGEYMTLKDGLKQSKNSVSVYLMKEIGNTERVRDFAADLGIPKEKIPNAPSICLGVPELSVLDMAGAYTAFADNGTYHKPVYIKRIEDKNGKVIYKGRQQQKKAINSSYNYVMVDMLKNAASFMSWIALSTRHCNRKKKMM